MHSDGEAHDTASRASDRAALVSASDTSTTDHDCPSHRRSNGCRSVSVVVVERPTVQQLVADVQVTLPR
jgi:hypothetical protein